MEIRTSDLYEAAYYLSQGVIPQGVICRSMNGKVTRDLICDFYFEDPAMVRLQSEYLRNEAAVNLALFRRCYIETTNYANNAMRDYRKSRKGGQK
jgi:hypothetical protein